MEYIYSLLYTGECEEINADPVQLRLKYLLLQQIINSKKIKLKKTFHVNAWDYPLLTKNH